MHFTDAAACRAAMRAGGAELDWFWKGITDQDAEWIASALADPDVRQGVMNVRLMLRDSVCHTGFLAIPTLPLSWHTLLLVSVFHLE